jgi:hypothetical protein
MHKEWLMRELLSGVLVGMLLTGAWLHAGEMRKPAGRVVLPISSTVAPGGGLRLTAAEGTLTLPDGTTHAFAVSGLNLQGPVGSPVDLEAKGEVYQLQRLEDFAGTYRRAMGEVDPERSTNTLIIQNEQGVRIVVTVTVAMERSDVRLLPSESGVIVKLKP